MVSAAMAINEYISVQIRFCFIFILRFPTKCNRFVCLLPTIWVRRLGTVNMDWPGVNCTWLIRLPSTIKWLNLGGCPYPDFSNAFESDCCAILASELGCYGLDGWATTYSAWRLKTNKWLLESKHFYILSLVNSLWWKSCYLYVRRSISVCFMLATC